MYVTRPTVCFPVNFLIIEVLKRYHYYYGDDLTVECPTGSGNRMNLKEVSFELSQRMTKLFLPDQDGHRPCHGESQIDIIIGKSVQV